jgi:NTP pyrophosphatase (non-canonical NTP hydrolase)
VAELRAEVEWFATAMERKLRANDHKRHWHNLSMQHLSARLTQERKELYAAIASHDADKVLEEAADVANFAMMVADMARRLYSTGGVGGDPILRAPSRP